MVWIWSEIFNRPAFPMCFVCLTLLRLALDEFIPFFSFHLWKCRESWLLLLLTNASTRPGDNGDDITVIRKNSSQYPSAH